MRGDWKEQRRERRGERRGRGEGEGEGEGNTGFSQKSLFSEIDNPINRQIENFLKRVHKDLKERGGKER